MNQATNIPTLDDLLVDVDQIMASGAQMPEFPEDMGATIIQMVNSEARCVDDMVTALLHAHGAHTAAKIRRELGDAQMANILHDAGQELLRMAVSALGHIAVTARQLETKETLQ